MKSSMKAHSSRFSKAFPPLLFPEHFSLPRVLVLDLDLDGYDERGMNRATFQAHVKVLYTKAVDSATHDRLVGAATGYAAPCLAGIRRPL